MHVGDPKGDPPSAVVKHVRKNVSFNTYSHLGTLPALQDYCSAFKFNDY
jgi:hypothetical protein